MSATYSIAALKIALTVAPERLPGFTVTGPDQCTLDDTAPAFIAAIRQPSPALAAHLAAVREAGSNVRDGGCAGCPDRWTNGKLTISTVRSTIEPRGTS